MRSLLRPPSPAMAVALLALFVSLAGSAFAVTRINGSSLVDRSVTNVKIRKNSLTAAEINKSRLGSVARAAVATNADRLGGQQADRFQFRCQDGSVRGFAIVNGDPTFPATFTNEGARIPVAFNCAQTGVEARRVDVGSYRVRFAGNAAPRVAVANAYGSGSLDAFVAVNREAAANEWQVVIHDSAGALVDRVFEIVLM
jgi:hypothetical protein